MPSDKEVAIGAEAGLIGPVPYAKVNAKFVARFNKRADEVMESASAAAGGPDALDLRLEANEELDVLVGVASMAAATSAMHDKRRLLARVVAAALSDEASIDEAALLISALSEIDAVHVRALTAIGRAEDDAKASGEIGVTARGAEKPLTGTVRQVVDKLPDPVLRKLLTVGLIEGSILWDGTSHVPGLTTFGERILADLRSVEIE
ncbi:hypothetical protein ASE12_01645 [Aeromicrobium sp. Root236]|uniref:hypothetical protein n=1 Tax=Aeromicrobium sp. Root236 TaxID=1736498 RepID=UPI0006F278F4|nr:hypothetical protein [Aeromicrobium sp. Root236]KRC63580.1 hypothetical protein ASE12_01645 [Aeromicrobium sp. Root236]